MLRLVVTVLFLQLAYVSLPARAETLEEFTRSVFAWTRPEERPSLIVSKGTVLAWFRDPVTSRNTANPKWYFNSSSARSLIIVPPGQFMIAFPPRKQVAKGKPSDRVQNASYWLAVTSDGFWGIMDHDNSSLYLNEPDIQRYRAAESGASGERMQFVMGNTTAFPFADQSGALTRGETARELSRLGGDVVITFDAPFKEMTDKQAQLTAYAALLHRPAPTTFHVADAAVTPLRVSDLISDADLDAWKAGKLNYQELFENNFLSLRVPREASIPFGCGAKRKVFAKDDSNISGEVTAELGAGGNVLTWLSAKVGLSGSAKRELNSYSETTFEETSITSRIYFPVELRQPDGTTSFFFAGLGRTCAAKKNWHTLVVDHGKRTNWLHSEFWELDKDGKEPDTYTHPTSAKLAAIVPGGDPFDEQRGSILAHCFRQEQAFEKIVASEMGEAVAARVAIALATASQAGTVNLADFFEDRSCSASPAGGATQTASAGPTR